MTRTFPGLALLPFLLGLSAVAFGNDLPMPEARSLTLELDRGTWMSVDAAPGGDEIVFDLLGHLYQLPGDGGSAVLLQGDRGFASQPVYSPDGDWVAFVSDRDGSENLWRIRVDGSGLERVTQLDDHGELVSPAFSADGRSLYASRLLPDRTVLELWEWPLGGGEGRRLLPVSDPSELPKSARMSFVDVTASPDGRYLYYSARANFFYADQGLAPWQLRRLELSSGREQVLVDAPGGGLRATLDPSGEKLVYATRRDGGTRLYLMDLSTGQERMLADSGLPVDQQMRWASQGLLPRMSFTADGRSLYLQHEGRLSTLDLQDQRTRPVPLDVRAELTLGPGQATEVALEEGPVRSRLLRHPVMSPDGQRIAFSALAGIHVVDLQSGQVRRMSPPSRPSWHPSWSPDGGSLVYVSWQADSAGHVWRVGLDQLPEQAQRLSHQAAWYRHPVAGADGESILFWRGEHDQRMARPMEYGAFQPGTLVRLSITDGTMERLWRGAAGGPVQRIEDDDRLYLYSDQGLVSIEPDGSDQKVHLHLTGRSYYFMEGRSPVQAVRIAPDGRHLLAVHWSQPWLVPLPESAGALDGVTIDLDDADSGAVRLDEIGGDHVWWSGDGRTLGWVLGAGIRLAERDDWLRALEHDQSPAIHHHEVAVTAQRDRPRGRVLLTGATLITMRGDEVIENGDVLVEDQRITALGEAGSLDAGDAEVIDLGGHYIIPGLIDAHAHWAGIRRDQLDLQSPDLLANLSWGVTSGLDVSTLTIDALDYQDLIDSGHMLGPRMFSTGPAIFSFNEIESLEDARNVVRRYRDAYRLGNLKQYRVGNRRQRQWLAMAAAELGLRTTTEGADNFRLSITQILDGYAGLEHALPVAGLGPDVIELMAATGVSYTPTLSTLGGRSGQARYLAGLTGEQQLRLRRFLPPVWLDAMTRWLPRHRDDLYAADDFAADLPALIKAGVIVAAGSHGETPGLGMHFEMRAMTRGGMTPHQALQTATIGSAQAIGRHGQLGSLEAGKLADLVVLNDNPMADIGHSTSIKLVMQNGRLFRAEDLAEIWPRERRSPRLWFHPTAH